MKNLGILLSGRGSNFVAIADSIAAGRIPDARIAIVISNRADAPGLEVARQRGFDALVIPSKGKPREQHDREVVAALREKESISSASPATCACSRPGSCSSFRRESSTYIRRCFLSFPGLEAQQQAFAYGVKITGCTVHFVDEDLDHGAIIVQKAVSVLDSDDEHTLAARILEQEHIAYSEAIKIVLEGKFTRWTTTGEE